MSPISFGIASPMRSQRPRGGLEPVDAAVVLLVDDVPRPRVHAQAVRIVAVLRVRVGQEIGRAALLSGCQVAPSSRDSKTPPAEKPDVEVRGIEGIDVDRVQRGAVGRRVRPPRDPRRARALAR